MSYVEGLARMKAKTLFNKFDMISIDKFHVLTDKQNDMFFELITFTFDDVLPIHNMFGSYTIFPLFQLLCPELHPLDTIPTVKKAMLERLNLVGIIPSNDPNFRTYKIFYVRLYEELMKMEEFIFFKYKL